MGLPETMLSGRSVCAHTDESVSEGDLDKIIAAGMLAPSGKGIRPWHFIVVTDPAHIKALIGCRKGGPKMLETATTVIAVLGDTTKSDACIEDSTVVLGQMCLVASSMGLGSYWLQARFRHSTEEGTSIEEFLRQRLGFPDKMELEAMLALGHPAQEPAAHTLGELPQDRVHREQR